MSTPGKGEWINPERRGPNRPEHPNESRWLTDLLTSDDSSRGLAELESQHIVPLSARKSDSPIRSSSAAGTFGGSPFLVLTAV
ncbi:MAG: hypothetical protein ACI9PP_001741, partial [Halobacteriales archaeon]